MKTVKELLLRLHAKSSRDFNTLALLRQEMSDLKDAAASLVGSASAECRSLVAEIAAIEVREEANTLQRGREIWDSWQSHPAAPKGSRASPNWPVNDNGERLTPGQLVANALGGPKERIAANREAAQKRHDEWASKTVDAMHAFVSKLQPSSSTPAANLPEPPSRIAARERKPEAGKSTSDGWTPPQHMSQAAYERQRNLQTYREYAAMQPGSDERNAYFSQHKDRIWAGMNMQRELDHQAWCEEGRQHSERARARIEAEKATKR